MKIVFQNTCKLILTFERNKVVVLSSDLGDKKGKCPFVSVCSLRVLSKSPSGDNTKLR